MRKLTKSEIDAAPGWADKYWANESGTTLVYCNDDAFCYYQVMKPIKMKPGCKLDEAQPIPRKDLS